MSVRPALLEALRQKGRVQRRVVGLNISAPMLPGILCPKRQQRLSHEDQLAHQPATRKGGAVHLAQARWRMRTGECCGARASTAKSRSSGSL